MNLSWLRYNNYRNRKFIMFDDLLNYQDQVYLLELANNINFNPNDGVTTSQVINWSNAANPDYVVVSDTNDNIVSRWFVTEFTRLRNGQYRAALVRDLKADYYQSMITANCIVKRGYCEDTNPLIFNRERQNYNQIKQSEVALYDATKCPWIVGYMPRDSFSEDTKINAKFGSNVNITIAGIENWEYYNYTNLSASPNKVKSPIDINDFVPQIRGLGTKIPPGELTYKQLIVMSYGQKGGWEVVNPPTSELSDLRKNGRNYNLTSNGWVLYKNTVWPNASQYVTNSSGSVIVNKANNATSFNKENVLTQLNTQLGTSITLTNELLSLNNKIIKDTTSGKSYSIHVRYESQEIEEAATGGVYTLLTTNFPQSILQSAPQSNNIWIYYKLSNVSLYLFETLDDGESVFTTMKANRTRLIDSPYDMFCMPYSDEFEFKKADGTIIKSNKNINTNIAVAITTVTGSANIYDLQILPYCPLIGMYNGNQIELAALKNTQYQIITTSELEGDPGAGYVIWCDKSSFEIILDNEEYKIKIDNVKQQNETDMWRLCSPNYSGIFEFNAAKNGGVDRWYVNCQYKPFNPFIHVAPNFKNLYGADFKDSRGLLLGGDYSMPIVTSAWANYQLNNKNYQNIFDRQIYSLEVGYNIDYLNEQLTSAYQGMIKAPVGGFAKGFVSGGLAGGIIGGVSSTLNEGLNQGNVAINRLAKMQYHKLQKADMEAMFKYNLQNIQAIPQSIAKTTALTPLNKYVPFIEYYTCTSVEKEQLINKLKWEGYTIMVEGQIDQYIKFQADGKYADLTAPTNYIEAEVLRFIDFPGDSNEADSLADEMSKGFYFEG